MLILQAVPNIALFCVPNIPICSARDNIRTFFDDNLFLFPRFYADTSMKIGTNISD